jgi:hypothetical protein
MTSTDCRPWFAAKFAPLAEGHQVVIASGCSVGSDGNIQCDPEAMRAAAEITMRNLGWNGDLSIEAYTLGRYMQGEVGSGPIEERVAVAEAAVNRAKLEGLPNGILDLLLYRQLPGHPNRGFYGPIHGPGGVSSAPYGRWATTSADPTLLTLVLAQFVIDGESRDFARGADDQDGPEYWIPQGQDALYGYIQRLANSGKYWVGPLPGVDHWHTFLQFTPGVDPNSEDGQALIQRARDALTLPRSSPDWSGLPICAAPPPRGSLWFVGLLGLLLGAWWYNRQH